MTCELHSEKTPKPVIAEEICSTVGFGFGPRRAVSNMQQDRIKRIKCVVIGDDGVGKTSLLITFTANAFPGEFHASAQNSMVYDKCCMVDDKPFNLALQDETMEKGNLRPPPYPQPDVFLICFSVTSPSSYESIASKWYPEMNHHAPGVPFFLVGTKTDLRKDPDTVQKMHESGHAPVTLQGGKQLASELGAYTYLECSALMQQGLEEIFDDAIRCATVPKTTGSSKCVIF